MPTQRVTQQTAVIFREIMRAPDGWHTTPDIADATGLVGQVVRQNLLRFTDAGWFVTDRPAERSSFAAPRRRFRLTAVGRREVREELKSWNFRDN